MNTRGLCKSPAHTDFLHRATHKALAATRNALFVCHIDIALPEQFCAHLHAQRRAKWDSTTALPKVHRPASGWHLFAHSVVLLSPAVAVRRFQF